MLQRLVSGYDDRMDTGQRFLARRGEQLIECAGDRQECSVRLHLGGDGEAGEVEGSQVVQVGGEQVNHY